MLLITTLKLVIESRTHSTQSTYRTNHYLKSSKIHNIQAPGHFTPPHQTLDPIGGIRVLILRNRRGIPRAPAYEPLLRWLRRLDGRLDLFDDSV